MNIERPSSNSAADSSRKCDVGFITVLVLISGVSLIERNLSREGDRPVVLLMQHSGNDVRVELLESAVRSCVANPIQV